MAYTWLLKNFTLGALDDCLPTLETSYLAWNGIGSCSSGAIPQTGIHLNSCRAASDA